MRGDVKVNARNIVAALYIFLFIVSMFNVMVLPSAALADLAPMVFGNLILSLTGALIAFWVYQDVESIKTLKENFMQLEKKLESLK